MNNILNKNLDHKAIVVQGGMKTGVILTSRLTVEQAVRLAKHFSLRLGMRNIRVVGNSEADCQTTYWKGDR